MIVVLNGKVAIVGIGQSQFGKGLPQSELELACLAINAALLDAGLDARDVNGMASYTMEQTPDFEIARNLGLGPIHFFAQMPHGGGAGPATIGLGAMAIVTGQANTVVVWRARKRSGKSSRVWSQSQERLSDHWKWSRPSGLLRPADEVAMLTRRYGHDYQDLKPALAEIAITLRQYAHANPAAAMRGKALNRDDYEAARMIADPLNLYDNCLESDGAVALVLTSTQRAQSLQQRPIVIEAFAQGIAYGHQSMSDFHRTDALLSNSWICAEKLWRSTDLKPSDVDVAQIYDAFSPLIAFSLEGYGFVPRGEAVDFILSGALRPNGALPCNTSGGSLSEAYLHGLNLATEAVRQLRGEASTQIHNAKVALVTGCDITPNGAILLRTMS